MTELEKADRAIEVVKAEIRKLKGDEEWECEYNPRHEYMPNGYCKWCGESYDGHG